MRKERKARKAALASEKWRENEGRREGEGNRPKTGKETQVASQKWTTSAPKSR